MQTNFTPYAISDDIWMVPCLVKRAQNQFEPLSNPATAAIDLRKLQNRRSWTLEEDQMLAALVKQHGSRAWAAVAGALNHELHHGLPVRQGKQCRERYFNQVDPKLVKGQWTESEDCFLIEEQEKKGNLWSHFAQHLVGRTENQVKNRFRSLLKLAKKLFPGSPQSLKQLLLQKKAKQLPPPPVTESLWGLSELLRIARPFR